MTNNQLTSTHLAVKSELDGYKIHASRGQATALAMVRLFESIDKDLKELQERRKAERDSEPVAYMTYKGYLLHAGDPKLAEYSEPTPLYADPRTAAMPAAPVAWLWSRDGDDERDVSLTPPDDDDDAADAIECGWTATPLYRHAQQPVVPEALQSLRTIVANPRRLPRRKEWIGGQQYSYVLLEEVEALIEDAYRAAMLQAGTLTNEDTKQAGNSPVIPDGSSVAAPTGIPMIPDGYVMVPKVATEKMLIAGLEEANPLGGLIDWDASRGDCNTREQVQEIFKAMLAAAPHDIPALNSLQRVDSVAGKWIPVSERMPEREYVLAADFSGKHYSPCQPNTQVGIYADWFDDGNPTWDDGDGNDLHLKEVTHWIPLPAAPQEVNSES